VELCSLRLWKYLWPTQIEFKFEPTLIKIGEIFTMAIHYYWLILFFVLCFGMDMPFGNLEKKPTANAGRVLIITYYLPPAGDLRLCKRWLEFVKYLRDFNIEPHSLIPQKTPISYYNNTFWREVPEGIKVTRSLFLNPMGFARIFSKK